MSAAETTVILGRIFTSDPVDPWAEALAYRDGLILAVGTEAQVREELSGEPFSVLQPGGLVCSAFHDAHIHLLDGSMFDVWCNLHDIRPDEYLSAVEAAAGKRAPGEWLRGGGWSMAAFDGGNPRREDLDLVAPDVPVYLTARDGHSAWINSRALELAGVTADTPDPAGGRIERDADGRPSGVLHETAIFLVSDSLPPITHEEWLLALEIGQRYMHSLGIVGWQDAKINRPMLDAYVAASESGLLRSKVDAALHFLPERGLEQIEEFTAMRDEIKDPNLRAGTVKVFVDGVVENQTAALNSPYVGDGPDNFGEPLFEPDRLNEIVAACTAAGFQVHFHAIGDWAVARALDACATSGDKPGEKSVRHQISHLQVVDPVDVPRFGQLGVLANLQPYWACRDEQMRELCIPVLGEERSEWQYPFESIRRSGATLVMGSDWRVSTPDPLKQIEVAHTRRPEGDPTAEPLVEGESLSLEDSLVAFTRGSAYASFFDDVSGSLTPGRSADIVFLSEDFLADGGASIGSVRVDRTIFEGQTVYEKKEGSN